MNILQPFPLPVMNGKTVDHCFHDNKETYGSGQTEQLDDFRAVFRGGAYDGNTGGEQQ